MGRRSDVVMIVARVATVAWVWSLAQELLHAAGAARATQQNSFGKLTLNQEG